MVAHLHRRRKAPTWRKPSRIHLFVIWRACSWLCLWLGSIQAGLSPIKTARIDRVREVTSKGGTALAATYADFLPQTRTAYRVTKM